jgi:DNA-binding SARP family transcriptional activator
LLSDALCGAPPVLCHDGYYCLNKEAGVGVDIACFEYLVHAGNDEMRANNPLAAADFYAQAVQLYRGDLCMDTEVNTVMERERLRAHFLTTLARLGDYYFSVQDYSCCLHYTERLLEVDPCREDAHRLVMRCYVRQGERAQALRQYHLCRYALRAEFDTMPEPRTALLYDQVRLDPESV